MSKIHFFAIVFAVLFFTGCNNKVPLGGKVSFPDGQPLTAGMLIFSNDNFLARAYIKPDGTYDVGSLAENDGLPAGKYKVYITGAVEVTGKRKVAVSGIDPDIKNAVMETEEDILESLIAAEYTHRDTTPLEIEVPGEKAFHITVQRP